MDKFHIQCLKCKPLVRSEVLVAVTNKIMILLDVMLGNAVTIYQTTWHYIPYGRKDVCTCNLVVT
jgi:hypothetical protein